MDYEITIKPIDRLNPGFGYELKILNAFTGAAVLDTSVNPMSGETITSAEDALEIASWYAFPCDGPDEGDAENGPPYEIEPCCPYHFPLTHFEGL